ncbi:RNA-directed DNA polymerase from mobile element jockey-like [Tachysurus ichikawai]
MRDANIVTLYKNKGDRNPSLQHVAMIFSLRQLQEKCHEQQMPLYIAFIDLAKAFDLISRSGLFRLLQKVGCPPRLLAIIRSFHENMHSTVCFNSATSEAFPVSKGVKQGCVLAPTLFAIFSMLHSSPCSILLHAFKGCSEGVYIHTRTDGKLFNIARLRSKTKVTEVLIRELLFADNAALTSHKEDGLQKLVCCFSHACKEFGLTINLKKTNVMVQDADSPPTIAIEGYNLEVVENYTYLGFTISNSLSIDTDVNGRIAKASAVMARLNQRVWNNHNLTEKTKLHVYQACVLSTLLYSSEAWTTNARHEVKLNSFHLRCLWRILRIQWQDKVPNT